MYTNSKVHGLLSREDHIVFAQHCTMNSVRHELSMILESYILNHFQEGYIVYEKAT